MLERKSSKSEQNDCIEEEFHCAVVKEVEHVKEQGSRVNWTFLNEVCLFVHIFEMIYVSLVVDHYTKYPKRLVLPT
jgi:hypothetical protein